jgi:hypothetical protein
LHRRRPWKGQCLPIPGQPAPMGGGSRVSVSVRGRPCRSALTRTMSYFYGRPRAHLCQSGVGHGLPVLFPDSSAQIPRALTCYDRSSRTPRCRRTPFGRKDPERVFEGSRSRGSRRSRACGRIEGRWPSPLGGFRKELRSGLIV